MGVDKKIVFFYYSYQESGFGFRVLGSGFWGSGSWFLVSGNGMGRVTPSDGKASPHIAQPTRCKP